MRLSKAGSFMPNPEPMARKPNEYHLVVFDPGGTIGWAHFVVDFKAFSRPEHKVMRWLKSWNCGEFTGQEHEQLESASRLVYQAHFGSMPFVTRTDVVSEDFELTQLIGGKNLLSPVRINAVIDWECRKHGLTLKYQARQLRTSVTAERLALFGFESPFRRNGQWSKTGSGKDAFAAMQHTVTWLRRTKEESRSKPWKLDDRQTTNARWDCACTRSGTKASRQQCDLIHP
jgi:hypothetical protein